MTIDLVCLVAAALWGVVLVFVEVGGKTRVAGPAWNAGNRSEQKEFPAWVQRCGRALDNHKENFPLFLTAVLVVHLANESDAVSGWASVGFVAARVLHGLVYIAGITKIRSVLFLAGLVCNLVVLSRLL